MSASSRLLGRSCRSCRLTTISSNQLSSASSSSPVRLAHALQSSIGGATPIKQSAASSSFAIAPLATRPFSSPASSPTAPPAAPQKPPQPPTRAQVLDLFRGLQRSARHFGAYNFREYVKRRSRDAFREHKFESHPKVLAALYAEGCKELEVCKRQGRISELYKASKLVVE